MKELSCYRRTHQERSGRYRVAVRRCTPTHRSSAAIYYLYWLRL